MKNLLLVGYGLQTLSSFLWPVDDAANFVHIKKNHAPLSANGR